MPKQVNAEELSTIDSTFFDNFEHESMERTIAKIVTELKEVNRIHRYKTTRKTFRTMMGILQEMLHQLELDESIISFETCPVTCRLRESDLRILHKANLAIAELLAMNKKLKQQQKRLKRRLVNRT